MQGSDMFVFVDSTVHYKDAAVCVCVGTYIVSEAQVEFLQDEQVSAKQGSGHGHVAHSLTDHGHCRAAAVQLRQTDPRVQTLTCKTQPEGKCHTGSTGFFFTYK